MEYVFHRTYFLSKAKNENKTFSMDECLIKKIFFMSEILLLIGVTVWRCGLVSSGG